MKNGEKNLKYVIIDECHWGNATEDETIQNKLVQYIKEKNGAAFGFTASPYQAEDGTFQQTWSRNKVNKGLDFNYYLDKKIIYPVTLKEVNLQNALPDFDGSEDNEIDLKEKEQVITFMAKTIKDTLPTTKFEGPAICFFSNIIIPDLVEELLKTVPVLKGKIKVLGSDDAKFVEVCREMFGQEIIADPEVDIPRLKKGENIFLVSRQKLLVGLNAPLLRYCFISPTNSKITIMQGIGRLMRPTEKVPKKLATLFLTSLSGKKLDISGKGAEDKPEKNDVDPETRRDEEDTPKTRYTTSSMTLSEAYDLPHKVFYKTEVGFRDFVNEKFVRDGNAVEVLRKKFIPKEELDQQDDIAMRDKIKEVRQKCLSQYKHVVLERDGYKCQGKKRFGEGYCERPDSMVHLEIHHMKPSFAELMRIHGPDGTIEWHRDPKNLEKLVTLCVDCHDKFHSEKPEDKSGAA
jgi:5-methylcytosine-specific restriction endonuclease McrA